MTKFTESKLEQAIIGLLQEKGYTHVLGETISRHPNDVLIKDDLRDYLQQRYANQCITAGEIDAIIRQLEVYSSSDLYDSNKTIMKMVSDGFFLKRDPSASAIRAGDRSLKDLYIQLIDYSNLPQQTIPDEKQLQKVVSEPPVPYTQDHNIYKIVNQLKIHGYEKRIPDGIIYINGLPLVVFEFKSAIREEATIYDAYKQLTIRYRRDIPELFKYNAFCVISDGVNNKAGSFFADYEYYYAWRRINSPHPRPHSPREKGVDFHGNYRHAGLVKIARELRQRQTPAEKIMWELLRNRQLDGLKFRRQHQIGPYVVDFYCDEKRLIIELDGKIHEQPQQKKKDHKRESYLKSLGFNMLRYDNDVFLNEPKKVLSEISNYSSKKALFPSLSGRRARGEGTNGINSLFTMINGLFDRRTLIDVIRNFIYFPDSSTKEEKILCRYPQYYAARKLYENIKIHRHPEGDGKGGTYFGATGCGKSYTMLFLTRLLMKSNEFSSPTIVLITDRTDLDDQLSEQFVNAKSFIGDEHVISVESRDHLRNLLKGKKSGGVYLTTIHKFTEDTSLLTNRSNIICISDEAHRTQTNLDQKVKVTEKGVVRSYGFAKYLHDSLPLATYVGFTGTPVDATLNVFGEVVDAYTMHESVKDEITVRIVYEGRAAKVILNNKKLEEIEDYYSQCAEEGASEYQIEKSKKANAKMTVILGDPDRIKALAEDFVKHYESRIEEGATVKGKAIVVSSSRFIAWEFFKAVIALRPEWNEVLPKQEALEKNLASSDFARATQEIKPMERIKMVMTRSKDDPKELWDLLGNKDYRKELDRQFKNGKSNFKIAIVVDMWLTGFDVPFLDTIYIDKPIQRHSLIQTISRVNRKFENKEKGLVVDYIGIKRQMNLALAHYSKADQSNIEEVEQSIIVVKDHLDLLNRIFHKQARHGQGAGGFDSTQYFTGSPLEQLNCLNMAVEFVQITEKQEKRFMYLVKRLKAAYDICCGSDAFTREQRDQIHFYLAIRSILYKLTKGDAPDTAQMNAKVREMISGALQSDGVEEIFKLDGNDKEVDIFDDDYIEKLKKIKLPNTKIKLLQKLLSRAIDDFKKINKIKGIDFSQRFKTLVDHYNERKEGDVLRGEVLEDFTEEILDIYYALRKERESFADLGIDLEEKAFYDILKALAHKYDFEYPEDKLVVLSQEVKKVVDDKTKYTDWDNRDDIKAELKADLIILLAKHNYPPVDRDEVYKEIFEQAENFKKYQRDRNI